jgi:hypothetical protein
VAKFYVIIGVDPQGRRHEVARASSASAARIYRDAQRNPWVRTEVYGPDGLLGGEELDRLAAAACSRQVGSSPDPAA